MQDAIELLLAEVRQVLAEHPWGHLVASEPRLLEVPLRLQTGNGDGGDSCRRTSALELQSALREEVEALVSERLVFRPGRVYCLRCQSGDCEHGSAKASREIFAGYGSTGLPRWVDLAQFLLERQDERVSSLYGAGRRLVAVVFDGDELMGQLLPAYRNVETGFRLHGQVAVGWYRPPNGSAGGADQAVAVCFQVLSLGSKRRPRYGLNTVGLAPDGSPLETLHDSWREVPWIGAQAWARRALADVERGAQQRRRATSPARAETRVAGLLQGLARRLLKGERASLRRTRHVEVRRQQGERPTEKALADLAVATGEAICVDTRRETLVVLADKGRTHVFAPDGRHVTSLHLPPAAVQRRRNNGRWRPATADEAASLRESALAER